MFPPRPPGEFFEVVNLHPSSRVTHQSSGEAPDVADSLIRKFDIKSVASAEEIEIGGDGNSVVVHNLRKWCTCGGLQRVAATLERWATKASLDCAELCLANSSGASSSMHRPSDAQHVAQAKASASLQRIALPDFDDETLDDESSVVPGDHALVRQDVAGPRSFDSRVFDARMLSESSYGMQLPASYFVAQDISSATLQEFEDAGLLVPSISDFSDVVYTVCWQKLSWDVTRWVGQPCFAVEYDRHVKSYKQVSKLECARVLLSTGWQRGGRMPLTPGGDHAFDERNLFRSGASWHVLLGLPDMFAKGVNEVHQDKPQSYDVALLEMNANRLQELVQPPLFHDLKDRDFRRALRGKGIRNVAEGAAALEDCEDSDDPIDDVGEHAMVLATLEARKVMRRPVILQDQITYAGIIVYLDNWTHSSGERRAFVTCHNIHHRDASGRACSTSIKMNKFGKHEDLYAWIAAWLETGYGKRDRMPHRFHIPAQVDVDRVRLLHNRGCICRNPGYNA